MKRQYCLTLNILAENGEILRAYIDSILAKCRQLNIKATFPANIDKDIINSIHTILTQYRFAMFKIFSVEKTPMNVVLAQYSPILFYF